MPGARARGSVRTGGFQELAFALSVGILIDAFVVRSLLAPALLTVMESASDWPGRQLMRRVVDVRSRDLLPR